MRYTLAGISLLLIGIALLMVGGFQGGFLLIFPMIITTSPMGGLGMLLMMLGSILLFLGIAAEPFGGAHENTYEHEVRSETHGRGMGIVLIGPIPLIIDTDNRKLTLISLALFAAGIGILLLFLL